MAYPEKYEQLSLPPTYAELNLPKSYAELGRIPLRGDRAIFVDCVLEDEKIIEAYYLFDDIAIGTKGKIWAIDTYNGLEVAWFDADLEEGERIPKYSPFTFREIAPLEDN